MITVHITHIITQACILVSYVKLITTFTVYDTFSKINYNNVSVFQMNASFTKILENHLPMHISYLYHRFNSYKTILNIHHFLGFKCQKHWFTHITNLKVLMHKYPLCQISKNEFDFICHLLNYLLVFHTHNLQKPI